MAGLSWDGPVTVQLFLLRVPQLNGLGLKSLLQVVAIPTVLMTMSLLSLRPAHSAALQKQHRENPKVFCSPFSNRRPGALQNLNMYVSMCLWIQTPCQGGLHGRKGVSFPPCTGILSHDGFCCFSRECESFPTAISASVPSKCCISQSFIYFYLFIFLL